MKKLFAAMACAALALVTTMAPTKALDGINPEEQRLLDYFEKGVTVNGETAHYAKGSEEYQTMVDLLATDGIDLTKEEVDTIRDSAKDVVDYIAKFPADAKMTTDILTKILDLSAPALAVFEMKAEYDASKDILTIKLSDGTVIGEMKDLLKETPKDVVKPKEEGTKLERTGENFTSTYTIIGGLVVVLMGAGFVVLRKKELAK